MYKRQDTYTQELMEADDGIQLYAPAPALTQFKLLLINSEKAGQEVRTRDPRTVDLGDRDVPEPGGRLRAHP